MTALTEKPSSVATLQERAARGGLASGISFAINFGLSLMQVPFLLRFWSQEMYGLWLSVSALATILTSLDGGHSAYVGNLFSRDIVVGRDAVQRTLGSAVRVAAFTATIQIVAALTLCATGLAARWIGIGLGSAAAFSLAVAVYTIGWTSAGSVGSIIVRLLPPTGHFVRSIWWGIAARVGQFVAVVAAAWLGLGIVATSLLFSSTVIVVNILMFVDLARLLPELFPWWKNGDLRLGFRNFLGSNVLTITTLLDAVSLQGVVLLVTASLGAVAVPLLSTLRALTNTLMQGTSFLLNPIQPDIVRYHFECEGSKLCAVFDFFWLVTGAAINGGAVVGLFFVEPLYRFWTHGKLAFDRQLFGWLVCAVLIRTLGSPVQSYLSGVNNLIAVSWTAVARAAVTAGGALLLVHKFGLPGVGAAVFGAELVGSLIIPVWFSARALSKIGGKLSVRVLGLAVISTMAAVATLGAFAAALPGWKWICVCSVLSMGVTAAFQWRLLPADVKKRAKSVMRPLFIR